jgi:Family of unknown function (DUF5681)
MGAFLALADAIIRNVAFDDGVTPMGLSFCQCRNLVTSAVTPNFFVASLLSILIEGSIMSRDAHGKFEKGFCGNPLGRPHKMKRTLASINHEDEFIEATEEEFSVKVGEKVEKTPAIDLIYKQLVRKAVSGDIRCMLKVIELRSVYASQHAEERASLFRDFFEAKKAYQRDPENYTDQFRDNLINIGQTFGDFSII